MLKILITENQFTNIIKEAVGVPENIIESGKELYRIISELIKSIDTKKEVYEFVKPVDIIILDMTFSVITVKVSVDEIDEYNKKPVIGSMAVSNEFSFNEKILMQLNSKSHQIDLLINFIVAKEWEPEDLYESFTENPTYTTSLLTHELKHKIDRQKNKVGLLGDSSSYQAYSSQKLFFGIPVIEDFMRYSYFIQKAENLVRPAEVASRMINNGVTKEEFYDFITKDDVYKELKKINNFSFSYLLERLYDEMEYIDKLLKHIGENPTKMTNEEKIETTLSIVYINLINLKGEIFDQFFYTKKEKLDLMMNELLPGFTKIDPKKEKVRRKYINYLIKYRNREIEFFKNECDRFSYETRKLMKKLSKIYSLIPDEKKETNESIINWDLNQKVVEKKYGLRPIQKEYNISK